MSQASYVPGNKNLPLVEATCRCGHIGKSRYPRSYRCSACYYGSRAASNRTKAEKLRKKAARLEQEAKVFDRRRQAFVERHPEAGAA
jgi:hypothetical protein